MYKSIGAWVVLGIMAGTYYVYHLPIKQIGSVDSQRVDYSGRGTQAQPTTATALAPPTLAVSDKLAWFNLELKDRLDSFSSLYEQGEDLMWKHFNKQCPLFINCPGLSALFSRYLDYKKALESIDGPSPTDTESFVKRLDDLLLIREHYFTVSEREILFGREQAWDEAALQRLQINQDPTLDYKQKRDLLAAHIDALPSLLKATLAPTLQLQQLALLRQETPDYNTFAAEFGPQAAQRLIELAQRRASWQQRVAKFQRQAKSLGIEYTAAQLITETHSLKNRLFNLNEQKRLAVYLAQ